HALPTERPPTRPAAITPHATAVPHASPPPAAATGHRAALPAPPAAHTPYRAPGTPVEQTVAEVFAQVLGRDRVGVDDSFFTLGGDSVMSILLVSRAKARGVHFTPTQVFEQRTVAGLAAVATTGAPGAGVHAEQPGGGLGANPRPPVFTPGVPGPG
uniref:phosphopantetheine-binding protein n=1 Tax=Nocardia abscessus TaxID=120957 RepID=UPI002457ADBF